MNETTEEADVVGLTTTAKEFKPHSQSKSQQTLSTFFRYSLRNLMQLMLNGSQQFVRCFKPNQSR